MILRRLALSNTFQESLSADVLPSALQDYPLSTFSWSALTKVNVSFTLDEAIAEEIDGYLRELVTEAAKSEDPIPTRSNVYEEIVKKGWEQVKKSGS